MFQVARVLTALRKSMLVRIAKRVLQHPARLVYFGIRLHVDCSAATVDDPVRPVVFIGRK